MEQIIPTWLSLSFIALTFLLILLILLGCRSVFLKMSFDKASVRRKTIRLALPLFFWLLFLAKISGMNFFHDWSALPPRIMIAVLPPMIFAIVLVTSKKMHSFIQAIPHHWLILVQSFRIVMELILLLFFLENILPVQMTFEGWNFDILSGLTALVVAHFVYRKKLSTRWILAWNIFGLLLLANIVVIAILSTPLPIRVFMNEPANTVVAYFPMVWLPGVVVPVAYTMHFLSIKKCLLEMKNV